MFSVRTAYSVLLLLRVECPSYICGTLLNDLGYELMQGVTTLLFPLTVLKTRQMASHGTPGGFEVKHRIATACCTCVMRHQGKTTNIISPPFTIT